LKEQCHITLHSFWWWFSFNSGLHPLRQKC